MKSILLGIDRDECPKYDKVIYKDLCNGCKHYRGFEMYENSMPCINCGYYIEEEN